MERSKRIQKRINNLLYGRSKEKNDKKILIITVLKTKTHFFNFLKAYTHFNVVGKWEEYDGEHNTEITIEFRDKRDDSVGRELMSLLEEYNALVVGEEKLYAYIDDIERSTL